MMTAAAAIECECSATLPLLLAVLQNSMLARLLMVATIAVGPTRVHQLHLLHLFKSTAA